MSLRVSLTGELPQEVMPPEAVHLVYAIDMGMLAPMFVIAGVLLWRAAPWGAVDPPVEKRGPAERAARETPGATAMARGPTSCSRRGKMPARAMCRATYRFQRGTSRRPT